MYIKTNSQPNKFYNNQSEGPKNLSTMERLNQSLPGLERATIPQNSREGNMGEQPYVNLSSKIQKAVLAASAGALTFGGGINTEAFNNFAQGNLGEVVNVVQVGESAEAANVKDALKVYTKVTPEQVQRAADGKEDSKSQALQFLAKYDWDVTKAIEATGGMESVISEIQIIAGEKLNAKQSSEIEKQKKRLIISADANRAGNIKILTDQGNADMFNAPLRFAGEHWPKGIGGLVGGIMLWKVSKKIKNGIDSIKEWRDNKKNNKNRKVELTDILEQYLVTSKGAKEKLLAAAINEITSGKNICGLSEQELIDRIRKTLFSQKYRNKIIYAAGGRDQLNQKLQNMYEIPEQEDFEIPEVPNPTPIVETQLTPSQGEIIGIPDDISPDQKQALKELNEFYLKDVKGVRAGELNDYNNRVKAIGEQIIDLSKFGSFDANTILDTFGNEEVINIVKRLVAKSDDIIEYKNTSQQQNSTGQYQSRTKLEFIQPEPPTPKEPSLKDKITGIPGKLFEGAGKDIKKTLYKINNSKVVNKFKDFMGLNDED